MPAAPARKDRTIHCGNSLDLDWLNICPRDAQAETYVCGNPPYSGRAQQTQLQKDDLIRAFRSFDGTYKKLDYISGWFIKASQYIAETNAKAALVSTNSICQGEHVPILWPLIFRHNVEISFAYTPFKWGNNASHNAFVYCVIIGLAKKSDAKKLLVANDRYATYRSISAYLVPDSTTIVYPLRSTLADRPTMVFGNMPNDGGYLILSADDRSRLILQQPKSATLIRPFVGSEDFINSIERYCLWITIETLPLAMSIPEIASRIESVRKTRLKSTRPGTVSHAKTPYQFAEIRHKGAAILVPSITSERRPYLTIGVVDQSTIISNKAFAVYNPPMYLFALLSSRLHWIWNATVGGRAGIIFQYANTLVYNTFPMPNLSEEQRKTLSDRSRAILKARHPGKSIAWLYDPETIPEELLDAHRENDLYIEQHIYGRTFRDDSQRLEHLFAMYARMKDTALAKEHTFSLTGQ